MNETQVTVVGNVVTAITKRRLGDGTVVANFRVGNNERRYDRSTDSWVPGERLYLQVQCWRRLAENATASLAIGDPVVVTGRLFTRNYEHEGHRRSVVTLDAQSVAADLSRCTATISRTGTQASPAPGGSGLDTPAPAAEPAPAGADTGTAPTSHGHPGHEPNGRRPQLVAAAPAAEA